MKKHLVLQDCASDVILRSDGPVGRLLLILDRNKQRLVDCVFWNVFSVFCFEG